MSQDYSVKMTLGYEGTDFERSITVKGVDSVSAATETVRAKVKAINASLTGGTDGGLSNFFRSDDFDAEQNIGKFNEIKQVVVNSDTTRVLIGGGSDG